MIGSKLFIVIGIIFTLNLGTAISKKVWCTDTKDIVTKECNSCLCIQGVPVCTKVDCAKVPKELWSSLILKKRPGRTLLILAPLGIGAAISVSIAVFIGGFIFLG
ncbi:hypothetical protein ILUMI_11563 [Ignelater luminosus]|uniref:Uncharacterized protein n=1 Tax=Ignelater luminosus TaxID=2038154 RepID=A0A8K0GAD4_IGNLU|nr:hypothetical protein ILUMI_11563 [Ignelater luminosus]